MAERKKVFHVIKGLGRGGAEKLLCEAYLHADTEQFQYGFGYFLKAKSAMVADLERAGAEVHCFGAANTASLMLSWTKLSRFLRRWEADLVHCHLPLTGVVGRIAGKMARVPVVYTEHNLPDSYAWPTRFLNLATWKMQEHVFAVSESVHSSIRASRAEGVPVQVVQNGVCTERFSPATVTDSGIRDRLKIADTTTVIGTVAGFRRHKRLDIWLEAASIVRQNQANVCFLLVGDGALRPEIELLIDELGLREDTRLVGMQEDVAPYLAAMDIYLMSSQFEGLPVALLEAMSMRLPVVATPVGGIQEAVADGSTGLLVPAGDTAAMASAVLELIDDQNRRRAMGDAGRKRVQQSFSLARSVRETEAVYARVIRDTRKQVPWADGLASSRDAHFEVESYTRDRNVRL